jgi:hypothetical protein
MLISVKFQTEFVAAVHWQVESRGCFQNLLQRVVVDLRVAGNFLACLPAIDERRIVITWYHHSVEAMGGS